MGKKKADFRFERVRDIPEGTPFVMIPITMLESPAWSVLGINHRRLLDFLMIENMAHAGRENGRLKAPRNQLEAFGLPRRFISSTIAETESLGFVDVVDPGMRGNIVQGRPGLYALTFVRLAIVDDFGRPGWAEPSHRYQSVTLDDAYRIVGKEPPARVLKSSSKVSKVPPTMGHNEQVSRVKNDPTVIAETAELCGSAKGSIVTQPSTSRGGGGAPSSRRSPIGSYRQRHRRHKVGTTAKGLLRPFSPSTPPDRRRPPSRPLESCRRPTSRGGCATRAPSSSPNKRHCISTSLSGF